MVFFGDEKNQSLSKGLAGQFSTPLFYPDVNVFSDGERRVRLTHPVVEKDVFFLKTASITPNIDSFIIETAFLIDAIKRSGARSITGIIPYLPYGRADHLFQEGEAVPFEVIIHLFENAGLTRIVFADPHTVKISEMFTIDTVNVSALSLFASKIREIGFDRRSCVLVTPDGGGLRKVKMLSRLLDNAPYVALEKKRDHTTGKVKVEGIEGDVMLTCFVIDDMISSGSTIVKAIAELEKRGARNIYVFTTHPVFSNNAVGILQESKALKVFVTDSIPVSNEKQFKKLEVLSLCDLIASKLIE
jgi:ribose-phosphate pyrophosphokinase